MRELRRPENLDAEQHTFLAEVEHDRAVGVSTVSLRTERPDSVSGTSVM